MRGSGLLLMNRPPVAADQKRKFTRLLPYEPGEELDLNLLPKLRAPLSVAIPRVNAY